jgi:hypothetical protein
MKKCIQVCTPSTRFHIQSKPLPLVFKIKELLHHQKWEWNKILNQHSTYTSHMGYQNFQKPSSHLKTLGARRVIWSKLHNEQLHILGATLQNFVTQATWKPTFVYPCLRKWTISGKILIKGINNCYKPIEKPINVCIRLTFTYLEDGSSKEFKICQEISPPKHIAITQ